MTRDPWPCVDVGGRLDRARAEWLATSGAGWTASSTLAGMHTRRQHGLLVAPLAPGGERFVAIAHVDATLVAPRDGDLPSATFELAKHQFPGVDPASGPFYLTRFAADPLPRFVHEAAGGELEVTLGLAPESPALVLRYRFRGARRVLLRLRPLLAMRAESELQRENGGMEQRVEMRSGEVRVRPRKDLPPVSFRCAGSFVGSPDWWRRFEYLEDRDAGLSFSEDLWTPGVFELDLAGGEGFLVASVGPLPAEAPPELLEAARAAAAAEDPGPGARSARRRLSVAAAGFCVERGAEPSLRVGFPAPAASTEAALRALPGLALARERLPLALRLVRRLIERMRGGFLPELLAQPPSRGGRLERVSAEATLRLFEVVRLLADRLGLAHPAVTDELLLALADAFEGFSAPEAPEVPARPARLTASGLVALRPGPGPAKEGAASCPIELAALWARGASGAKPRAFPSRRCPSSRAPGSRRPASASGRFRPSRSTPRASPPSARGPSSRGRNRSF